MLAHVLIGEPDPTSPGHALAPAIAADPNPPPAGMAVSLVTATRTCFSATVRVTGTLSPRDDTGTSCNPGVPLSAVLYGSDSTVVQVVRDNRIETRPVTVGIIAVENVEILEGLSEGDEVVVRAGSFLREDDLVRPVQLRPASSREAQ